MAINYLASLDLNQNELVHAAIENQPNDTSAGTGVDGQLYFDTTNGVLKVYDTNAWKEVGGGVESLTAAAGTFISFTTASSATGDVDLGTFDLSATGTASSTTFLRGDNVWATPPDNNDTYTLQGFGTTNGTAGVELVENGSTQYQVDVTGAGTTTVTQTGNTLTVTSNDQFSGTVTSVGTGNTTFIDGSGGPITGSGSLSYSLSATGSPSSSTFLRGDNVWSALPADENDFLTGLSFNTNDGVLTATVQNQSNVTVDLDGRYLTGNQSISLTGDVTGSGTTSITTTLSNGVIDIDNFQAATIVTEAEGIENNDNDTTIPTSAAVKDYVDSAVVGGLIYQGGYNAATNTPDLDQNPSSAIQKGWTYTVTADGTFFTEQVRVGDVLIAEVNSPTALADWTTVQNNVDLADLNTVGIGNVNAGTGVDVTYNAGTATVTVEEQYRGKTGTITAGQTSGSVSHNFGLNTAVTTYLDNSTDGYPTVYCEITRTATSVTATINNANTDDIVILVTRVG